jgi:2-polyprenyl-3-methyl-5-hydroxy-6-metoxy-1,4-benzoquinol methylase
MIQMSALPLGFNERYEKTLCELKWQFEEFCRITTPCQKELALSLLSKIGSIDVEGEGLTSTVNQRDLSLKFHWGHNHKFDREIEVRGRMGDRHLSLWAQFKVGFELCDEYFEGKKALDIGCWTGGTTLSLAMLGASSIDAVEEVAKYRNASALLCNQIYSLNVGFQNDNLYSLRSVQEFDLVYFPGVIYHLSDPVLALRRLYNALAIGGEILVETMAITSDDPVARFDGNRIFHNADGESLENLNRGGWNWFVPSQSCLCLWMQEAGFKDIASFMSPIDGRLYARGFKPDHQPICQAGLSVLDAQ